MKARAGIGVVLALVAASAFAALTQQEREARFYYDLGSDEVDVSGYPDPAKKGYALFRQSCSKCHSPARALNSPLIQKKDWERFVKRMHVKAGSRKGAAIGKDEAAAIVEFLSYDSKKRKSEDIAGFEALTRDLKARFESVRAEQRKEKKAESRDKSVPAAPYTGTKPRAD